LMPDDRYQVDSCHILLLLIYIKIGTLPVPSSHAEGKLDFIWTSQVLDSLRPQTELLQSLGSFLDAHDMLTAV